MSRRVRFFSPSGAVLAVGAFLGVCLGVGGGAAFGQGSGWSAGSVPGSGGGPELSRAGAAWHWILKLQTTGSVLQITAHPDDENGALLTMLGRGFGVRTALLSLTRGEAGANAIGPELFDDLGWIRAAELEGAGRWYGLDRIYFTPLADYGFSKSLEEARRSWDEEAALAEVVEIVRRERPLVVLARFGEGPEDGHGQHRFAGHLAARAFEAAPDLYAFPPREGRRGFLPGALFVRERGGDGAGGDAEGVVSLDLSGSRPWLSYSFSGLAARGLAFQRSQTQGVVRGLAREAGRGRTARLRRLDDGGEGAGSADLLELLGPGRASLSARFGNVVPRRLAERLRELDFSFAGIAAGFDWTAPERSLPALGAALAGVRELLGERSPSGFFEVRHELERKGEQLAAAARAAAGVRVEAVARAPGEGAADRGPFAGPAAFGPVVPGQEFVVEVSVSTLAPVAVEGLSVAGPGAVTGMEGSGNGGPGSEVAGDRASGSRATGNQATGNQATGNAATGSAATGSGMTGNAGAGYAAAGSAGGDGGAFRREAFRVVVAEDAPPLAHPVFRSGLSENRYRTRGDWSRAAAPPAFTATARLSIPVGAGGAGRGPALVLPDPGLMVPVGAVPTDGGPEERVEIEVGVPVARFEANLPYGYRRRVLEVLPPVSVAFAPDFAVAFPGSAESGRESGRELGMESGIEAGSEVGSDAGSDSGMESGFEAVLAATGHAAGEFRLALSVPAGFRVAPEFRSVHFERAGESARVRFRVFPAGDSDGDSDRGSGSDSDGRGGGGTTPGTSPGAVASAGIGEGIGAAIGMAIGTTGGTTIGAMVAAVGSGAGPEGVGEAAAAVEYTRIVYRDLPLGYRIRPAALRVAALEASPPRGLVVGFVVGAGDRVPEALSALGAEVRLLDDGALAGGSLDSFDAIVLGTRAYAFRPALAAATGRLLDYARGGGHLVVLYNTDELVPAEHAPFPGVLPRRSEEVSEEDAPVTILAPDHPLLTRPFRIGPADFGGWVEQRGSKFWSAWDDRYTPLFGTNDAGQAPQRGGALTAAVGAGRYTYFAFALHRQLPEAVPGAFRLLANLASWRRVSGDRSGDGEEVR